MWLLLGGVLLPVGCQLQVAFTLLLQAYLPVGNQLADYIRLADLVTHIKPVRLLVAFYKLIGRLGQLDAPVYALARVDLCHLLLECHCSDFDCEKCGAL